MTTTMTTNVQRYDRGELRSAVRTAEGYYLVEGFVSRPGVLEYVQADGSTRRELVLPEELHRTDSLETLGRKPVTLEHPDEFLTPENVGAHSVGDMDGDVEIERLNGFVRVKMAVRRADGIAALEAGICELSPGYVCDLDATPGTHPKFGPYDAIQRNRVYNHTAITRAGRAGPEVRLRKDSAAQVTPFQPEQQTQQPTSEEQMTVDIRKMVEEQLARRDSDDKLKRLESENEELKKKLDEMGKKMDEFGKKEADKKDAEKEKENEDTENEDEDDENKDSDEEEGDKKTDSIAGRLKWFERRQDALEVAARVGAQVGEKADIPAIKRAVVKAVHGQLPRTDSAYISAAYDLIKSQAGVQSHGAQQPRTDAYSGIGQALFVPPTSQGQQPAQRVDSAEDAYMKHFNKAFSRK